MPIVEVKNPTERNKLIAAVLLGVVAIGALYFAFGRSLFSSGTATTAKSTPTPRPTASPGKDNFKVPTRDEQNFNDVTTPIVYIPGSSYAPDAGRNIFAFYEPPPPTPYVTPSPPPVKTPPPPTPTPPPPIQIAYVNPQTVYAGSKGLRLEVNGDKFTPDAHIYFSQTEMPTTFINEQKIVTDIPANLIAQEGPRQIIVQTPDGTKYSNQYMLNIQAPPRPAVQYIGMIGRKRYNNDTAYFIENGKTAPFGARLNDVVGGRFRLVNISAAETVFEDVNLGFKHRIQISKATGSTGGTSQPPNNGFPSVNGFPPNGGFMPGPNVIPADCVPGIPCNIPRAPTPGRTPAKKDVDDNDDGDGGDQK